MVIFTLEVVIEQNDLGANFKGHYCNRKRSFPMRPLELIYPSVGSTCNKNTLMRSEDDFENLFEEFEEFPHEKMLQGKDQKIAQ